MSSDTYHFSVLSTQSDSQCQGCESGCFGRIRFQNKVGSGSGFQKTMGGSGFGSLNKFGFGSKMWSEIGLGVQNLVGSGSGMNIKI